MTLRAVVIVTGLLGLSAPGSAQIAPFQGSSIDQLDPVGHQSTGSRILEQVLSNDDMQPVREFAPNDIIRRLAKPVGRLTLQFKAGPEQPGSKGAYCTASLISTDLIITNYHCVPGNGDVTAALLTMGYLQPRSRQGVAQYPVGLQPVESSKELDFAILRVEGQPGNAWGTVALSNGAPGAQNSLFIIHHPGGYPQYITQGRCQTSAPAIDGDDLLHVCDTLPGSSGAPIFDNSTRKVVGLHYSAVALKKLNAGKLIASIAKVSPLIAKLASRVPDDGQSVGMPANGAQSNAAGRSPRPANQEVVANIDQSAAGSASKDRDPIARVRSILGFAEGRVQIGINGGNRVKLGKEIVFDVLSKVSGRLIVIDLNAAGEITQIYPNSFVPSSLAVGIRPNSTIKVPGPGYGFTGFKAIEPTGRGRLMALVIPATVRADRLEWVREQIPKGFQPVQAPGDYLAQLTEQLSGEVRQDRTARSDAPGWAFAVTDYEIVK